MSDGVPVVGRELLADDAGNRNSDCLRKGLPA
jgi:hypothetical protein